MPKGPVPLTVQRLSIAPVRSLGLQHPDHIMLGPRGVAEDRRFWLVDPKGRIVDRLVAGDLVRIEARTDPDGAHLWLRFPDGTVVEGDVDAGESFSSGIYGVEARGTIVTGPWAEALTAYVGRPVRLIRGTQPGATRDGGHVSLLGDGSLRELGQHLDGRQVDGRRFRMLIDVGGCAPHVEDEWIGSLVAIGEVVVRVNGPVARCAITTQDPDSGQRDMDTLRTIIGYRGLRERRHVDFGVLADVVQPGRVELGDPVMPIDGQRSLMRSAESRGAPALPP